MRTSERLVLVVALLAGIAGLAGFVEPASAGLDGSPHDLSAIREDHNRCASCHPPHVAGATELPWDRAPSTIQFGWSDVATSSGTRLPTNVRTWAGSTRVCLACHDGTIDMRSFGVAKSTTHPTGFGANADGNHPVAIPYPYNGTSNTYNGITTADAALKSGWVASPRDVKLFADTSRPGPNNHGIECATCHDPHGTSNRRFLRAPAGEICQRCHRK